MSNAQTGKVKKFNLSGIVQILVIIYKERYLNCDWSIQLILNKSAAICNNSEKSVIGVQKFVTKKEPIKFDVGRRGCKFS